ncbi:MAG: helix-turn-helix domain-containing protein [Pseudonocardiaceae bacterium]
MADEMRAAPVPDPLSVGQRVRARRKQLGLTQRELAAAGGVAESTVRNLESGRTAGVRRLPRWAQIERALGWPAGSLATIRAGRDPLSGLPPGLVGRLRNGRILDHDVIATTVDGIDVIVALRQRGQAPDPDVEIEVWTRLQHILHEALGESEQQ